MIFAVYAGFPRSNRHRLAVPFSPFDRILVIRFLCAFEVRPAVEAETQSADAFVHLKNSPVGLVRRTCFEIIVNISHSQTSQHYTCSRFPRYWGGG
jgi:hypothetical protein